MGMELSLQKGVSLGCVRRNRNMKDLTETNRTALGTLCGEHHLRRGAGRLVGRA